MEIMNLPELKPRHHLGRRIAGLLVSFIILSFSIWGVLNRQFIIDQITVWQYNMPVSVSALAENSGMSDHGKFLFKASKPELNDKTEFNQNCTMRESRAIVLGCYKAQRIYVFDVTDERIRGVKAVTAAHEMLHAAYERLGGGELEKVNKLLEEQLARTTDQGLLDLLDIYAETQPGQEFNELHSLFGTEVADLIPDLETYYKKYFDNRDKVVKEYQRYSQVFADLNARAEELKNQLDAKNAAIATATAQHEKGIAKLAFDVEEFNRCAQALNCFASQEIFQRARAVLFERQNDLQTVGSQINAQIDQYNNDIAELNALGIEAQKLNQSIDSHAPVIK